MQDIFMADFYIINEAYLSQEFSTQAAMYVELITNYNRAETEHMKAKANLERIYAEVDQDIRDELAVNGKKYTETVVKSLVLLEEDYIEEQQYALHASKKYMLLKQLLKAMEMRADMLISLGAHLRAEISMTQMNIKEKDYDAKVKDLRQDLKELKKDT